MFNRLIVLHEYGAPNHYVGLKHWASQRDCVVEFVEFSVCRQAAKGLIRAKPELVWRALGNLFKIFRLLFESDNLVVVGAAPYDWRIIFVDFFTARHCVAIHTSWPFWLGDDVPHKGRFGYAWQRFVRRCIAVFAVSESSKEGILARFPCVKDRVHVVGHSVRQEFYTRPTPRRSGQDLRIIFVGRVERSKGIHVVLELARHYQNDPAVTFSVVGENIQRVNFSSFANVKYCGAQSRSAEVAQIMSESEILILPSIKSKGWQELFGMVLIEAAAMGLYCIATDHVGPSELIDAGNGISGHVVSEEAIVDNFIMAIERYRSLGDDEKTRLSKRSRELAQRFSVGAVASYWGKGLEKVLRDYP